MSLFEALILGILQGAAEFLPISSSGHLVLVPWWLGWDSPPLVYDVIVHVGTTTAIIIYFWQDWLRLLQAGLTALRQRTFSEAKLLLFIIVGTIPAAIVGFLLEDYFESTFSEPAFVAAMLLVTATVLTISEKITASKKALDSMTWLDAILIGCAQAVAIMPGISRSGSTIAAGLSRDFIREESARFSFLLATPIILGAGAKKLLDVLTGSEQVDSDLGLALVIGYVASAVVGYLCIAFLLNYLRRRRLYGFAVYCAVFGLVSLVAALVRG